MTSQSDERQLENEKKLREEVVKAEIQVILAQQELARIMNNVRCAKIQYRSLRGYRDGC